MTEYLPDIYTSFRDRFPVVAEALDALGAATGEAGPLDHKTRRLVKLGIAVGAQADGAVRSNVRKALQAGATADEIRHVVMLAVTTAGFPHAMAGLAWADEVLEAG
jgi:alkylhydroperoxidase/carboxymuconolactone decarboxylase family protein YurZ